MFLDSNMREMDPAETAGTVGVGRLPPSSGPGLCGQAALLLSIPTRGSGVWLTTIGTRSFSEGNNEARLTSITVTSQ